MIPVLARCCEDYRYRRRAAHCDDARQYAFPAKTRARALVITGLIVGPAMFLKSDSYCCCRSFWPIGGSLIGTATLHVGIPMVAALSVHALFLAAASRPYRYCDNFEATGTTSLHGLIITIPTVIVAGPLFSIAGAL